MPSQTSPSSGYRPGRAGRTAGSAGEAEPVRQRPPDPSWLTVIGTTLRLWLRRRVLRVPDSGKISAWRRAGLTACVVVIAAAVAVAAVALTSSPARRAAAKPAPHRVPVKPAVTAEQLAAAANVQAAAGWIAAQVSGRATVACDPYVGGQLVADGFPPGQEDVLQPGRSLPEVPVGQAGGAAATLIVQTRTLGTQYGAQLATVAPVVLASFGSGPGAVLVRLRLRGGAAAAQQDAVRALAARRTAGRALLKAGLAHMHPAARQELAAGAVDPRLITVLRKLAAADSIYISSFGNPGRQAGPLRLAQIDGLLSGHGTHQVSELKQVLKLLRAERLPYRAKLKVAHGPAARCWSASSSRRPARSSRAARTWRARTAARAPANPAQVPPRPASPLATLSRPAPSSRPARSRAAPASRRLAGRT